MKLAVLFPALFLMIPSVESAFSTVATLTSSQFMTQGHEGGLGLAAHPKGEDAQDTRMMGQRKQREPPPTETQREDNPLKETTTPLERRQWQGDGHASPMSTAKGDWAAREFDKGSQAAIVQIVRPSQDHGGDSGKIPKTRLARLLFLSLHPPTCLWQMRAAGACRERQTDRWRTHSLASGFQNATPG